MIWTQVQLLALCNNRQFGHKQDREKWQLFVKQYYKASSVENKSGYIGPRQQHLQ